jgi:hypothetical protein
MAPTLFNYLSEQIPHTSENPEKRQYGVSSESRTVSPVIPTSRQNMPIISTSTWNWVI